MTDPNSSLPAATPAASLRVRYRIRFAKRGLLRWISHRDLAQLWERMARRVALPLSMTEGFHPRPRIAFASALALGIESYDEVVELELTEAMPPAELLQRLQNDRQPGLTIQSVHQLPERFGKAQLDRTEYTIVLTPSVDVQRLAAAVVALLASESVSVQRKQKAVVAQVANDIPRLELVDGALQLSLVATEGASLRPDDVLELLGLNEWREQEVQIIRTKVVLQSEFESADPAVVARAADLEPVCSADLETRCSAKQPPQ